MKEDENTTLSCILTKKVKGGIKKSAPRTRTIGYIRKEREVFFGEVNFQGSPKLTLPLIPKYEDGKLANSWLGKSIQAHHANTGMNT